MPKRTDIGSILIIGSGPIVIGQKIKRLFRCDVDMFRLPKGAPHSGVEPDQQV